jgi:hypothetical protein
MRYQGSIGVGAGIFRASIVLLVGCPDLLCGSELLLPVKDVDLLLPCFNGSAFMHAGLIDVLVRGNYDGEEGLLPCGAAAVAARAIVGASSSLLFIAAVVACCSSVVGLEVEAVLVPVKTREVVAAGVGGFGWPHALGLGLGQR